jgi:hypothetical protein
VLASATGQARRIIVTGTPLHKLRQYGFQAQTETD